MKRVAVIVGGSSGMGLATGRRLHNLGWHIVQADIKQPPGDGHYNFYPTDVAKPEMVSELFRWVEGNFDRINLLMICSGVHSGRSIVDTTDEDYQKMADINMRGNFLCIRGAIPLLRKQHGSSIITISSDNGLDGDSDAPLYCGTKHFIVGLTRSLSLKYKETGVRVNCLCPGPTDTTFLRDACGTTEVLNMVGESNPLGRLVKPEEIAEVAAMLATNQALNGCIWNVDGGVNFSGGNFEPPKIF